MVNKVLQISVYILVEVGLSLGLQTCTSSYIYNYYCYDGYFCCGSYTCCAIWWIVLAVIGALACLIGIPVIIYCCKRKRSPGRIVQNQQMPMNTVPPGTTTVYPPPQGYYPQGQPGMYPQVGMQPQAGMQPQPGYYQGPPAYGQVGATDQKMPPS